MNAATGAIAGTVADPTGAVVPQAAVNVLRGGTLARHAVSDALGHYSITGLAPGTYSVEAQAPGFRTARIESVHVARGATTQLVVKLEIDVAEQQVVVSGNAVDSSPDKNGDALVMKGSALDALSDDQDELQQQLQAIAGADPETGTQFYVDGFSGGKLPPKSAIREIRINQNPYSAQYDQLGYGRIEIFTKPGADKLHGEVWMQGNNSPWNAQNPFVTEQPPYHAVRWDGDMNGPISKVSSFFASIYGMNSINESVVNAEVLDDSLNPVVFKQAVSTPTTELNFSPRYDLQWGKIQTITIRYELNRTSQTNGGIGQFALASQGYNSTATEQILQMSDSQAYGAKVLNETRFQYIRDRNNQTPASTDATIAVQGAFTGGGSNIGVNRDNQDHYEFQDYLHVDVGPHDIGVGGRLRGMRDSNYSTANFNGQFTFASLSAYQITMQGIASHETPAGIRAAGGGASLFSQTSGAPGIAVTLIDTGLYAEDNWKVKPDVTLSYGMRFETQTDIHDRADFAPRLAVSWAVPGGKNKPPRAVIRAGYGWFFQRFQSTNVLQARRENGVLQKTIVINQPDFYPDTCTGASDPCGGAQAGAPTIYQISPQLHAPYYMIDGIGVDKPMGKIGQISLNYVHWTGKHLLLTRNINAPLPGTYDPADPASGVRPLSNEVGNENIYQYDSEGVSKRDRLIVNVNVHTKYAGLFAYYMLGKAHSDTDGVGTFPSDQYDPTLDYGRAAYDVRNRAFIGGYTRLPWQLSLNPFVIYNSGQPFNIVVGEDLNGDTQFNDRPAFATDLTRPSVYQTKWGAFDADPIAGQTIIPINYGKGPGLFVANLRMNRSFHFGPPLPQEPAPGAPADAKAAPAKTPAKPEKKTEVERKYELSLGFSAQNIFNHPNYAQPVGVLGSTLFGRSTAITNVFGSGSADRTLNVEMFFRF
ncbi:MAG TPA: TonB-dependent receptor [Terracidiphilus sp.]|nr:TonB-dependent receptor [Terracidiphilus sp.]